MSKVRLCFLNTNLRAGGAEQQLVNLARCWRGNFDTCIVLLERQNVWLHDIPSKIPVYTLSERMPLGAFARIIWALRSCGLLHRFLRRKSFDVIVSFQWLPTLLATAFVKKKRDRPILIWSVQSDLKHGFERHADACIRKLAVKTLFPKRIDHFVATSKGIKKRTRDLLKISEERLTVIPNGTEITRILRLSDAVNHAAVKTEKPRILSVGRLHRAKGMDILLRALAEVKRNEEPFECIILGDGEERKTLGNLVVALDLWNCVKLVGFSPNPYAWLRSADIFVSASRWESFGIVLIEAMAIGLPVVATATDGALDIIDDGLDGLLVPVGDYSGLAYSIIELLKNPEIRRRLGSRAQLKARKFDAPAVAKSYINTLEKIVGR